MNTALMKYLQKLDSAVLLLNNSSQRVENPTAASDINSIASTIKHISDEARRDPKDKNKIRKLANHYVDIICQLVEKYIYLEDTLKTSKEGENVSAAMQNIQEGLCSTDKALKSLLDSMFTDEAMETSADIDVLERLLSSSDDDAIYIKRYCRYCGARMSPTSCKCPSCGQYDKLLEKELDKAARKKDPLSKRILEWVVSHLLLIYIVSLAVVAFLIFAGPSIAEKYEVSSAIKDLEISSKLVHETSSWGEDNVYITGTVINTSSSRSYDFIEVEVVFLDNSGAIVDTDVTYLIYDEIRPNKKDNFTIYSDVDDPAITDYTLEIIEASIV